MKIYEGIEIIGVEAALVIHVVVRPFLGVEAPGAERLEVFFEYVLLFASHLDEGVVVGEGAELDIGVGEILSGDIEAIGEDGYHALDVAAFFAEGVDGDE